MRIEVDEVIGALGLKRFGAQGWLTNKDRDCPFCGRGGKNGLMLNPNGGVYHCWYCNAKKPLKEYLKAIDRMDLAKFSYEKSIKEKLFSVAPEEEMSEEENLKARKVEMPQRLQPLVNDSYLNERGFKEHHYNQFEPSFTSFFMEKDLHNYIIFKLKMNGEEVAWLARSRYSYEWHKRNLEESKESGKKPKLRYENSKTDFTKIVGGYDNVTDKTEIVILVEGLFDSIGIDNLLCTEEDESIRCCFLFSNSISREQILLLKKKPSLHTVIVMFDDNTEEQSKSAGLMLSKHFNTKIAHLTRKGVDPNDMDIKYFNEVMDKLEDPINFYVNKKPQRW